MGVSLQQCYLKRWTPLTPPYPARTPTHQHTQPNTPTLLAYAQLAKEGLTGAPVVSAEGELIANLSFSDIRCGDDRGAGTLLTPCHTLVWLVVSTDSGMGAGLSLPPMDAPPAPRSTY
jgi:hypothetical protein